MTDVERMQRTLRTVLAIETGAVTPGSEALQRIRELIKSKTAAPADTGTAGDSTNGWKEPMDMAIEHHEDASLYGKGVIHHPLGGRPEFKGLIDNPDGPMVRIQDGDLVLLLDDLPLLLRWRDTFELAAIQLGMRIEAMAKHQAGGARS